jgi:hypothetical protein
MRSPTGHREASARQLYLRRGNSTFDIAIIPMIMFMCFREARATRREQQRAEPG